MRNLLLLSIGAALVVGGVAFYLVFSNSSKEAPVSEIVTENEEVVAIEEESISGVGSMNSLLEMGANLECSVIFRDDQNTGIMTEGTYFTSLGRMRGDFVVSTSEGDTVSSMILDGEEMYSWTEIEGEKYGMKISLSDLAASKESDSMPEAREAVSLDADVRYNCQPWDNVDSSIFVPPNDTIFKDYKDLMNVGMEYGTSYEGASSGLSQCAVCDQLSGTPKAECKAALSCQ
jgi:hypothetical protein